MRSLRVVLLVVAFAIVLILGISDQAAKTSRAAHNLTAWASER